jgi:hypothetical protein
MWWVGYLSVAVEGEYGLMLGDAGADAVLQVGDQPLAFGAEGVTVSLSGGVAYALSVVADGPNPEALLRWRLPGREDWQPVPSERLLQLAVM